MKRLTIRRPDDLHLHLRDGYMLKLVAPLTAQHFARALVMPNLKKPVVTPDDIESYRSQILEAAPTLQPLMTIKLLDGTTPATILAAKKAGAVAAKLYPRGVTTNAEDGVSDPLALTKVYEAMEECGMVLCLHGETPGVFCMDRERVFLDDLTAIATAYPKLKIVLEHITTAAAAIVVRSLDDNVAATITVHHLMLTLDDVVGNKLEPHHFCKPIAKTPQDREALRKWATSGCPKFFLGTDSAPHSLDMKECSGGCAGVFSAPVAMPLLAQLFEEAGALDKLENFTSYFGARFYGLTPNEGKLTLIREPMRILLRYSNPEVCALQVQPLGAGLTIPWSVADTEADRTERRVDRPGL